MLSREVCEKCRGISLKANLGYYTSWHCTARPNGETSGLNFISHLNLPPKDCPYTFEHAVARVIDAE